MAGGAPKGNQNAVGGNQRLWDAALRRAIAQDDADRLRKSAEQLLTLASQGEQWAIKELADRIDGKVAQAINLGGQPGNPVDMKWTVEVVDTKPQE